ncbi:MAG: sigma-54 dependent transcriptional regulator [Cytophagales bacterium]|nr:sigma-54 dependent transcriptional regulator [Bernardetiaceae bacterium]MDW8211763.1 sigma-54 dependent transcriptional regulator [Cytophagales bacterium]
MKNILVSWLDYRYDFDANSPCVPSYSGMTWGLHRYFIPQYNCYRHYLLSLKASLRDDPQMEAMLQKISHDFPTHRITPVFMDIADPIDLAQIKGEVEPFLLSIREEGLVHIFYNAGYQMMQLAWVLCCMTSCRHFTRLFHMRKPEFTQSGCPEILEIDLTKEQSTQAYGLLKNSSVESRSKDTCITSTMRLAYQRAEQIASLPNFPALIMGPSGSGKEQIARYIHQCSGAKGRFIAVNCAALPDELLQAELFGYKKGAFTGATEDRSGYFEAAAEGTLFLDEIGDASAMLQQSLLRVLQDGLITPLGDRRPRKVSLRIVAATHRPLLEMVAQGRFRDDLYYRLNPAIIRLCAWADLPEQDRRELFYFFWQQQAQRLNHGRTIRITSQAQEFIIRCHFPGNIRQLQNLIASLYVFYRHEPCVTLEMVLSEIDGKESEKVLPFSGWSLESIECQHIQRALQHFKGNLSQTARALGISLNTLKAKMKKFALQKEMYS